MVSGFIKTTTIQERLKAASRKKKKNKSHHTLPSIQQGKQPDMDEMPIRMTDYFELLELTGKVILDGKRGPIPSNQENILSRNNIEPEHWLKGLDNLEKDFPSVMGNETTLLAYCAQKGRYWVTGFMHPAKPAYMTSL